MPKIRDLGINAVPEKRAGGREGLFAACQGRSDCPREGQSECPNHSAKECAECTDTGICGDCSDRTPPPPIKEKKQALTDEANAQLQSQPQEKMPNSPNLS